ncbi:putative pyruvate decarboxylase PdcA [Clohesyomyces aquaticus]|uniref:Pyruvate decarboxylase n=1 Tax=Clohesyomyces aquaticus TaxID=1231657 RepID=A0A1Y2A0T3_9PLEO|nr:putative pyruvate decarboxylase PdcA [Clohesyomyces aquaticus]
MSKTVNLAHYMFTRLRQLGVRSVHGVPGDYTLRALDYLKPAGLKWIGNCNELNAGYAADGYARIKGISALFTTYGVGELSALNAVAESFAEFAPVDISLGDGSLGVYADIYMNFTVAQASLFDPSTAAEVFDEALEKCMKESRPIYVNLPSDMVGAQVLESPLGRPLEIAPPTNEAGLESIVANLVLDRVYSSKRPYILEVNELARVTGFPTFASTFGGGTVDSTLHNYHGVHGGGHGSLDFAPYTNGADLALLFRLFLSDTNTQGWSAVSERDITLAFRRKSIEFGASNVYQIHIRRFMRRLLDRLEPGRLPKQISAASTLPSVRNQAASLPPIDSSASIDQDSFYLRISSFFRPHDIIVCANGTPLVGGRDFVLPPHATLINSAIWLSVGHMFLATQGISLAQSELGTGSRTIFFEGDGSFQATAQELGTIDRYKLNAYIFIINNGGYTFERLIHGLDAEYNDVAPWRYLKAPEMMGARNDGSYDFETHDVGTWGELQSALGNESFQSGKGLKLVNVRMGRDDLTSNFKPALKLAGKQLMAETS